MPLGTIALHPAGTSSYLFSMMPLPRGDLSILFSLVGPGGILFCWESHRKDLQHSPPHFTTNRIIDKCAIQSQASCSCQTLETVLGKELTKVWSVLSSIVSNLTIKPDFNENFVLTELSQSWLLAIEASITSAQIIPSRITKPINVATAKFLTAVAAVLLPSICFGSNTDV